MATDEELVQLIAERLDGRGVACAESCTAGALSGTVAAAGGGASEWFRGGLVAYQEAVKRELLDVGAASVVSEAAAREMAAGISRLLRAEVAVATTGVVGDEPLDGQPPGTVAIATQVDGCARSRGYRFHGSPADICERAVHQALEDLLAALGDPGS